MSAEPGSDDEPYGEVQRVASSSTAGPAAPALNPDDVANYASLLQEHARSIFSRAHDSKGKLWRSSIPQAEEQRLAPPSWTDAELSSFYLSLPRHSRLRPDLIAQDLGGTKTIVQVAHYLNLLHDASEAALAQRSKSRSRAAALKRHPAAIEVDDDWVQREEQLAEACRLPQHTSSASSPRFSWNDDGVAAAAVYVMHHSKPESEADASNAPAVYRLSSLVASLRVPASRRSRGQVRGDVQKGYRDFTLTHPQAPSLEEMRQRGDGNGSRPTSRMHVKKKRKREQDGAGRPDSDEDDEADGEEEDEADSGSAAHRLVLRMCELGLLWRVVEGDAPRSSDGPTEEGASPLAQAAHRFQIAAPLYHPTATVIHQFSTAHKALHVTSSQPQRLPTLFLDPHRLVWATDVTAEEQEALLPRPPPATEGGTAQGSSTFKHSMRRRMAAGRASLVAAKEAALDRLLSSVRCEELDWLEGGVVADVSPDFAAQPGDDSIEANRGGRGRRSSTFRGHSLEGMSDKERELFKARIRKEDQKKSLDELNGWSRSAMSPATPNAASSSSSSSSPPPRASSPSSGKTSLLDPFKPLLQPLSRPQRLKAEARLRKRVRLWGLEKTMQVGLGSLDVDVRLKENSAVRRRSASGDVASPGATAAVDGSDELGQTDVAAALQAAYASQSQAPVGTAREQDASGQDDEARAAPSPARIRHDARSARFRAIGITRAAEIVDRLRALARPLLAAASTSQQREGEMELVIRMISLRVLARLVRANADGTRLLLDDDQDEDDRATTAQVSSPLAASASLAAPSASAAHLRTTCPATTASRAVQVDLAPLLVFLYEGLRAFLERAIGHLADGDGARAAADHRRPSGRDVYHELRIAGLCNLDPKRPRRGDEEGNDDDEEGSRGGIDAVVLDWQQRREETDVRLSATLNQQGAAAAATHVLLAHAIDHSLRPPRPFCAASFQDMGCGSRPPFPADAASSEDELCDDEEGEADDSDDLFETLEEQDEVAHIRAHWRGAGACSWIDNHHRRTLHEAIEPEIDNEDVDEPWEVLLAEEHIPSGDSGADEPGHAVCKFVGEGHQDEGEDGGDDALERRDVEMDETFAASERFMWLGVS